MSNLSVRLLHAQSGHKGAVYAMVPGRKEREIITGSGDGMIVSWDILAKTQPKALARVDGQVFSIIQHTGTCFIGTMAGAIYVITLGANKELINLPYHKGAVYDLHRDGTGRIWAAGGDGKLSVWDGENYELIQTLMVSSQSLRTIAIDDKNDMVAVGASDNFIYLIDLRSFQIIHKINAHKNSVFSLAWSGTTGQLISGSRDAYVHVWHVGNNVQLYHAIPAHRFTVNDIVFRPDGQLFATASRDKEIRIWNAESFELLKVINTEKFAAHLHSVNKLIWSDYLVSTGDDGQILTWKIKKSR